ncbi:MAG: M1 family metallopeptidase [Candidatus Xenobia bacterium]
MRLDPHSYNDNSQAEIHRLEWWAEVDFVRHILQATVLLHLDREAQGTLDLDTRDLKIHQVEDAAGREVGYTRHPAEPILGSRLELTLPQPTPAVKIRYETSPEASALQWLSPQQTSGGQHPFLFSQCQAIHARSVLPLQDTPRLRIRYDAHLTVPQNLRALMAAAHRGREGNVEHFEMPQPIAPYLFALAVGNLAAKDVSPRCRVWAEPEVLEKATWEFEGVNAMLEAGEKLFGPYDWERFDILTMPQSFPYGGMENPRLTFLTPTLLAGDRSLVNVVAHELAHSWTGNLVSNASADHFWLNEGFTVYAERRIQEALEGAEMGALHAALGRRSLETCLLQLKAQPDLTKLRTKLAGIDPDDAYSVVPYEKGYLFLRLLEEKVGRPAFDAWLRDYVKTFRFRSITTEDFEAHFSSHFPKVLEEVGKPAWLDGPGLPENAPRARSERLEAIEQLIGRIPTTAMTTGWTPAEWQLYLENQPRPWDPLHCHELDARFALSDSTNYEVLAAWLVLATESGYDAVLPQVERVLGAVGRMKFLKPLYQALLARPHTQAVAKACFERYADRYHPIARQVIAHLLPAQVP